MTIIIDYYIWFLIGGVVLLLITIGYLAEQTNFGKSQFGGKIIEQVNNDSIGLESPVIPSDLRINDVNNNINGIEDVKQTVNEPTNVLDDFSIIPDLHNAKYPVNETNEQQEENNNLIMNRSQNLSNNDTNFNEIEQINNETSQNDDIWKF